MTSPSYRVSRQEGEYNRESSLLCSRFPYELDFSSFMDKYKDLAEASTSVNCRGRRLCYGHVPKQDGKKGPKAHPAQFSVPKKCINGLSLLGVLLIANQFGGNSKRTDDH